MTPPLLITTFAPWKAAQRSNAADDLLLALQQQRSLPANVVLLRHLPVHFQLAPSRVIAKMVELCPPVVICCGMAENRTQLSLELNGRCRTTQRCHQTTLDLAALVAHTCMTEISHSAGTYVCNHLFFSVLEFIARQQLPSQGLFIHVPRLTAANQPLLLADLTAVIQQISVWVSQPGSGRPAI